ncbi:MAG: hypothetical protein H7178_05795 [Chitinophagaceae bacterium]|nr:hypothetical protein [Chitinophagaceae bacterium]
MSIQQLRNKLINDIQQAGELELKNMLKFYQIAQQQKADATKWESLSENNKMKIANGLQQLKDGKGTPAAKAVSRLNKKYGIA